MSNTGLKKAESWLTKMGWKPYGPCESVIPESDDRRSGQGLGKNEDGMKKPIAVDKKEENTGVRPSGLQMPASGCRWADLP